MALRPSTIRQLLRTVRFAHSVAGSSVDPQRRYEQLVDSRTLRSDEHQQRIIDKLQQLHSVLQGYDPPSLPEPKLPSKVSKANLHYCDSEFASGQVYSRVIQP
jgi:predicted ATPase